MRYRTLLAITVNLGLLAGALLGCGGSPSLPSIRPSETEPTQAASVPALVLMAPQTGTDNDDSLRALVQSLNDLNPSLRITLTLSSEYESDLAAALASDRPPDVFLITTSLLPQLISQESVRSIPDGWIERSQLLRAAADAIELDSRPYCFPHSIHTAALVYNADLFRRAGVELPTSQWTWQDFVTAAAALTDDEEESVGLVLDASPTTWIPLYLQAGGEPLFDEQGEAVFTPGPAQVAAEMLARLFAQGVAVAPADLEAAWAGEAFARGNVGMTIAGDWILGYLEDSPPAFEFATIELPQGPVRRANVAYASCLAVHAASIHPDLALQLAAQLTAPEVLRSWTNGDGDSPSVYLDASVATNAGRSRLDPYLRALRYATPWRYGAFAAQYEDLFAEGLALAASDELAPEEFWPHLLRGGLPSAPP